ncbi:ORF6N domain-containing protein [Bacillus pseudomycoides]|uniref:ORF6N domain-containing protein n=1 Tax=Bacillus pseudomycoides TaxID=64104 RepID=UPI0020D22DC3|nr:ORF6N domain-containing protein [Bacillus pseudomycoides]
MTIEVIESKQERDNLVERVEVLERVKELLLLPNMEMATTSQVAEFYGVETEVIRQLSKRNKDELEEDGYCTVFGKELRERLDGDKTSLSQVEPKLGHFIVHHNGCQTKITYTNNALFPKRAILRVGMLLRDSEVAKEVRTQLLNIEENSTQEVKTQEIDKEMTLEMNIGRAISKGDYVAVLSEAGLTRTFIRASNELSLLR